jgi:hypothetical protein
VKGAGHMDERRRDSRVRALLLRTLAAVVTAMADLARAWNTARAWTAPRRLLVGFVGAATQRAGLPLPIILAALVPLDLALRGLRRS